MVEPWLNSDLPVNSIQPKLGFRTLAGVALILACGFSPVGIFAAGPPETGNKIQFTDPNDGFHVPKENVKDELTKQFEFLDRQNSLSGVIAPTAVPTTPSTRTIELYQRRLDEKKNWIYQRPDSMRSEPTIEEMFGVRSTGSNQRSKSVMAEFFETPERKASQYRFAEESKEQFDRVGTSWLIEERFGADGRTGPSGDAKTDERSLIKREFSIQNGFVAPEPVRPNGALDPKFRQFGGVVERNTESRNDDFRKLLITQTGINPLAPGFDPINLNVDATRQQLNPIAPLGMEAPPSIGSLSTETIPTEAPGAAAGRIGGLLGSGTTISGPSSLSPAEVLNAIA
jgi:hypothetical protein